MSTRVRCARCRSAFLTDAATPGTSVECPKCGASSRLPDPAAKPAIAPIPESGPTSDLAPKSSVFVPSAEVKERSSRRFWILGFAVLAILATAGLALLVYWPRLRPRPLDPVERVASDYLRALMDHDEAAQRRLSTIAEPPAIRSFGTIAHDKAHSRAIRGSFAPLARLHERIASEFSYDPEIGRFTPKNPLGAAGATLDAVHEAKEKAEKSGLYDKMASGDPDDLFDAAEGLGKVFSELATGALAPKKILPTYKMLVGDAKPPIAEGPRDLATDVAEDPKAWDALLHRPFHTLKADGPFILERARVDAQVTDHLASLGDPPTTLRLDLVRFRLEGIDTGWRITSARRVAPGEPEVGAPAIESVPAPPRSLGNSPNPQDTP